MTGQYTALLYRDKRLDAIPMYFGSEEYAIEVCVLLMNTRVYYQILLYAPSGQRIATYEPGRL